MSYALTRLNYEFAKEKSRMVAFKPEVLNVMVVMVMMVVTNVMVAFKPEVANVMVAMVIVMVVTNVMVAFKPEVANVMEVADLRVGDRVPIDRSRQILVAF